MTTSTYTPAYTRPGAPCPVCGVNLDVRPSTGRKSNKPFLMFICPVNGKHFRGFITDQEFMRQVLAKVKETEG